MELGPGALQRCDVTAHIFELSMELGPGALQPCDVTAHIFELSVQHSKIDSSLCKICTEFFGVLCSFSNFYPQMLDIPRERLLVTPGQEDAPRLVKHMANSI